MLSAARIQRIDIDAANNIVLPVAYLLTAHYNDTKTSNKRYKCV